MPGFFINPNAAEKVPSSLTFAATEGFSRRQASTGASATMHRSAHNKNALEVDFGSVPLDPATAAAISGPIR